LFWCISYYLGAFGTGFCPTTLSAKRVNWCKSSCHKVASEFFATNAPDPPHSTLKNVLVHFIKFWCIWDHLVDLQNSMQNGPYWCKSSCHEAASEFFATKAPVPPHWTLNSCFGAFRTILGHCDRLVELRNSVQNGPNWCKSLCQEVAAKFFTTNAPDPPHWTLNSCVGV